MLGEGVQIGAGQRAGGRRAYLPRRGAAGWSDQILSTSPILTRDAVAEVDISRPDRRDPWPARPPARRAVARRVGRPEAARLARRAGGRRDGRIGGRRRAGPRRARRPRLAPDRARPRLRAAGLDDARHDRAVRELLGQHRGDARRLRAAQALGATTIVATTGGKLAEQARADGVPVIPLPGGFQSRAAVGYSLVVALEVARLCGAGGAAARRDRRGRRARRAAGGALGAGRRRRQRWPRRSPAACTARFRRSPEPG